MSKYSCCPSKFFDFNYYIEEFKLDSTFNEPSLDLSMYRDRYVAKAFWQEDDYVVQLVVPGMKKEQLSIKIEEVGSTAFLIVKGEAPSTEDLKRFQASSFKERFTIPAQCRITSANEASAMLVDGILEIKFKNARVRVRERPYKEILIKDG